MADIAWPVALIDPDSGAGATAGDMEQLNRLMSDGRWRLAHPVVGLEHFRVADPVDRNVSVRREPDLDAGETSPRPRTN